MVLTAGQNQIKNSRNRRRFVVLLLKQLLQLDLLNTWTPYIHTELNKKLDNDLTVSWAVCLVIMGQEFNIL